MAEPRITGIEVHTYTYTLNDLGTDYNGFNLVYVPGSTTTQTNHIIRILTMPAWLASMLAGAPQTTRSCHTLPTISSASTRSSASASTPM